MKRVIRVGKDVKARKARVKELMGLRLEDLDREVRVGLIQELIPLGLMHVAEVLEEEVKVLAGVRYRRNGVPGHVRWARQWGSVYLGEQKLPVLYQRVRDRRRDKEVELSTYRGLQKPRRVEEGVLRRILLGLSCRRYQDCCFSIPEAFGLSPSAVSRRFIRASSDRLKELMERSLEGFDIVAVFIDGKSFREDEMIMALGVTMEGKKVILGFIQAGTENGSVCKDFFNDLVDRGLSIERGLLCVVDGSRGIRKAVEDVFGRYGMIQRCQWHKRENVVSYLPKSTQDHFRKALQRAYGESDYRKAKEAIGRIKKELSLVNESAVRSLEEGLEETLTLHRLGLIEKLGRSFKTTNCIESIMALVGQRTDKVDYWKNSNQKQRWLAAAVLDIEPRLNRINGHMHLPELREAIQRELGLTGADRVAA